MKILRGATVFLLCALVSMLVVYLMLSLFSPSNRDGGGFIFISLISLPFIILGGAIFGALLLLTSERKDRARMEWIISRGSISGLIYSAILMFSFGARFPEAFVWIAAGGVAGAVSGFLWCRLIEQQDV